MEEKKDIDGADQPKLDWEKIPHRPAVKPFMLACEDRRKEIFDLYSKVRPNIRSPEPSQEAVNLAFELAKQNARGRALAFLTFNVRPLTVRKVPQYKYHCKFCGAGAAFRVKEVASALDMAHKERTPRGTVTLCTMAKPVNGVLKPFDQGFGKIIEEFQEIEKALLEVK